MYSNESKTTANYFFFSPSVRPLPDCFDNNQSLSKFTSANPIHNFREFGTAYGNDRSVPIRFTFDDLSELGRQSDAYEDVHNTNEEFADSPYTQESQMALSEGEQRISPLHHYACNFSPITSDNQSNVIDTKSFYSKNADTSFEAKDNTFNSCASTLGSRELDYISRTINDDENDLNKYVSDLISF
jgi:hypothetical protein